MSLADTVVGRGESEHKTQTAKQLIPMSPVAKKHSVDRPIRGSVQGPFTDWTNRRRSNRSDKIFTNLENIGMMGKHRDLAVLSDHITY